jgi:hypothetical protein
MSTYARTDWIVLDYSQDPPVYRCRRCGESAALILPMDLKTVARRCEAFIALHASCKAVKP